MTEKQIIRVGFAGRFDDCECDMIEKLREISKRNIINVFIRPFIMTVTEKRGDEALPTEKLQELINETKLCRWRNAKKGINFYDSTLPESIAYRKMSNIETPQEQLDNICKSRYDLIFYIPYPPSPKTPSAEQKTSMKEMQQLDQFKRQGLKDCGYEVVEVPAFEGKNIAQQRLYFILNYVAQQFPEFADDLKI